MLESGKIAIMPTVGAFSLAPLWPWIWIVYWVIAGFLALTILVKFGSSLYLHYEKVKGEEARLELERAIQERDQALAKRDAAASKLQYLKDLETELDVQPDEASDNDDPIARP